MRAFLAVAVLAASCTARSHKRTGWERLKRRMSEGAAPTSDDVELMLDTIEDVPAARGEVLKMMTTYLHSKYNKDSGPLKASFTYADDPKISRFADDPFMSRLQEVETFESLLDMAMSDYNRCEAGFGCDRAFLDYAVNLLSTVASHAKKMIYSEGHEVHTDLNLLLTSRADDLITLTQRAADRLRAPRRRKRQTQSLSVWVWL